MRFALSRWTVVAAAAGVLAGSAAGAPAAAAEPDRLEVTGVRPAWATPQARSGDLRPEQQLSIALTLPLRDPGAAQALARSVSEPGPSYRRFLDSAEFRNRFGPTADLLEQVQTWARAAGLQVTATTTAGRMVTARGSASVIQRAFQTTLGRFRLPAGTAGNDAEVLVHAPSSPVTLPRSLRAMGVSVLGLDSASSLHRPMWARSTVTKRPESSVEQAGSSTYCAPYWRAENNTSVPQRYPGRQSNHNCGYGYAQSRAIHQLNNSHTGKGASVGIVGAYNLSTILADVNRNAASAGAPRLKAEQYIDRSQREIHDPSCTNRDSWLGEQALDVTAVRNSAPESKIYYYGAANCTGLYESLARAVSDNEADVLSLSWGTTYEAVSEATRTELTQLAVQAAIQGQSIVVSSGDSGDNSTANPARVASPSFPAINPWVSSVGGTTVALRRDNGVEFATGWQNTGYTQAGGTWRPLQGRDGAFAGGGGGGISALYEQPEWQREVVPQEIAGGRRVMPDIASAGDANTGVLVGYTTAQGYAEGPYGGTSWSAPTVAALVADAKQQSGTRTGFLNPALYGMAGTDAFLDVRPVQAGVWQDYLPRYPGSSTPTERGSYLSVKDEKPQSLQSAPGWDAVTGLGMPAGAKFLDRLSAR
ncbi:S53 family peptidase [Crossiella sp. SN42]|uniref:S53 family peptidase n=1 Tax=Crossiella sp. SN42 TaxID=2944808 RepID=UPI00207D6C4D|nr:S53 family peptidase [Crossiella sp. SN42]MCO1575575.1 S53 family peptidase [Crossiella sp. SN42]